METKLIRIAEIAKTKPKEVFTSLYHLLDIEALTKCHNELAGNKAAGIDEVTKSEYSLHLEDNISGLVERLKKNSYKPQAVRRVYIPKGDGKEKRPLGIPAYEDKIIQSGLNKILKAIYESRFSDNSFGFRPERSCHQALIKLNSIIEHEKINYIVDADIKGFFNNVDHEWIIKFLDLRIKDPNIIRLIKKFLKAGVLEEGIIRKTEFGMPQGSLISPILSNIYLHYVLDLWFEIKVRRECKGQARIVRYADDYVCCFQFENEAKVFYEKLKDRLAKFNLEIEESKTKIIMFGRFAEERCKMNGQVSVETFEFLGFTHYCSKSNNGKFRVKRKTSKKKFRAKLQGFKIWIKAVRNLLKLHEIFEIIKLKLRGHYQYYGISDNSTMIKEYKYQIEQLLFKWLNRRSQRKSFDHNKFNLYLKLNPLPTPKIYVNIYNNAIF
ncbi:MAG: group II intron reverse transcriptase/maturase [Firmicutes bacterium]|nr:group II intron reverse transcriptase/maturase [Bacillota bacterium]